MKRILQLGLCVFYMVSASAQQNESQNFGVIPDPIIEQDNYYSQLLNEVENDLSQLKGTGYMQYVRERWLYEQRRSIDGSSSVTNRWEVFQNIREFSERSGSGPMANWQNIGPIDMDGHGGRMISHAFDPNLPDVIWAGSASGGLWLSQDGGDSWSPKTDNIPSTGVGAVAVKPDNSSTIIIGTGEGYRTPWVVIKGGIGVFKSIDGGETWLPTNYSYSSTLGVSVLKIAWHPTNTNILWMAATNGLWKSIDGGDNWSVVFGDGTNHQNFIFNDIILQSDNPDIIFVAQENVGILKSIDGGNTFNLITNGLPTSNINFISIDQSQSNPDILYTSITRLSDTGLEGVYKSTDNGTSWSKLLNTPNAFCITNSLGFFCQGWYNNTIAVSPIDPDLVLFGGISFWRTTDGGITWEQKDRTACPTCPDTPSCMTYVDHHDIGFDPHDPTTVYSINDGGISKSINNGTCWTNANNGLVTAQFLSVGSGRSNTNIVIGGLWDHGLQGANIQNGLNWERWGFFDGVNVAVDFNNANNYFGTWINGTYWRSSNGTNSFATQITNGINLGENTGSHFAPLSMHPTDSNILLGSTQQGLYKSINAGTFWVKKLTASIVTDLTFSQADPSVCYAAAWTGSTWSVYNSNDTGETWQQTSAPGWRMTDIKTSGQNSQTVFISRNSINANTPHIYKSTNTGITWNSIQGDLPDIQVNAIAVDHTNEDIIYAATDLGVYITTNGGVNWTEFNHGLPITFVTDIEYNPVDNKLRVATLGRGVWISDAYDVLSIDEYESLNDVHLFPNPTNSNKVFIRFPSSISPDMLEIEILNYLGQRLQIFHNETLNIIDNTIELTNLNLNQSDGFYFVRIKLGNRSIVKKLIAS
ncbi:T9SS type A sorting domain-containing protein [uncultured Psychroserpens sp.]|uniref:T9SS type A sorting domain-containing protein n=1 Tax=uncultured Psychroserpens sp. TaxID=255436 RepID=UPI002615A189|nr:T9SS type A sorting domain-containing protein [uncultured Psychroserpens sp.]